MARLIKSTDLGNGTIETVHTSDGNLNIGVDVDGKIAVTAERVKTTRINGEVVGGLAPGLIVRLSDDQVRALPGFNALFAAISALGDSAEAALEAPPAAPADQPAEDA